MEVKTLIISDSSASKQKLNQEKTTPFLAKNPNTSEDENISVSKSSKALRITFCQQFLFHRLTSFLES